MATIFAGALESGLLTWAELPPDHGRVATPASAGSFANISFNLGTCAAEYLPK
jgi:hypothetical protein